MKKLLILSFMLACLSINAQKSTVKVLQEGFPEKHELRVAFNGQMIEVNPEGAVVFEGEMDVPGPIFGMVLKPSGMFSGFWIEPGATEVIVRMEGYPENIDVTGSKSHALYKSLRFAEDNEALVRAFAKAPNDTVAIKHLNEFFRFLDMETGQLQYMYEMVSDEKKDQLRDLKAYITTKDIPKVTIDRDIYDFRAQDENDNSFSTKDYRGQFLLLDFASTGCGPCWVGYPDVVAETSKYENLQVLTFNQDYDKTTWQRVADSKSIKLPWPVLWKGDDKEEVFHIYGINGWPTFFLISPEGKVLDTWMGSGKTHMTETLKKLVK